MRFAFWRKARPPADKIRSSFADGFKSKALRVAWYTLSTEEKVVAMADLARDADPPKLIDEHGRVVTLCPGTMLMVVSEAFAITPQQYEAIALRIRAKFDLAMEQEGRP